MAERHNRDAAIIAALSTAGCAAVVILGLMIFADLALQSAVGGIVLVLAAGACLGWWSAGRSQTDPGPSAAAALEARKGTPPYDLILDALPDPVLVIAADDPADLTGRRFIFVNAAARELLKIQQDSGLLVTSVRDPQVLEAVDEALFGNIASETLYEIRGAQDRVLRAIAKPLGAGQGGGRLAVLALRDETDVRRAERTRADFLANASHELRTPLASLLGFIETLRGHAKEDEGAREKFLAIMQAQAERMSRLIDDLLSLSRIELNEHIAPDGEVDLTLAVMDVLDAFSPVAADRSIKFDTQLPPLGESVSHGDRDQIVQVIQNLVDNALKYTPTKGAVRIVLQVGVSAEAAIRPQNPNAARLSLLTPDPGPELYSVLRVTDTGQGIARENLPRLTERFYRVKGQKSGERAGTGLGLAIVKHIVNRHRGGMTVESLEGQGTTFSVYIPSQKTKESV